MSVTLLALGSLLPAEMEELDRHFDVLRLWREPDPDAAIRARSREIKGILSTYNTKSVSRTLIEALPNLEIIAQFGVGYDNIDLGAVRDHQLALTNTPDILTEDTADIAFALILAVARRIVEGDMFVRVGKWASGSLPLGTSLQDKTVGILGLGRIGKAIARRADAFGMNVLYHGPNEKRDEPYRYYADLIAMAKDSDFLVVACPGGKATEGIVDLNVLERLGPRGFLINIARGAVVRDDDLLTALSNRAIAGAGLDVYWNEPAVPDALISLDNVALLPHIGSATVETRSKMGQLVISNLLAHFDGKPLISPVMV
ncbi:MAG: 2-hydroxyacid dehydrogenase [Alphaproteobacteria bacterium]|nr:2-hydroxyacid dehydrogenase [Alphaproteobacteria bacterium]